MNSATTHKKSNGLFLKQVAEARFICRGLVASNGIQTMDYEAIKSSHYLLFEFHLTRLKSDV